MMEEIPGYEIQNLIGKGAFGEVYNGKDSNTGKQIAIKLLNQTNLNESLIMNNLKSENDLININQTILGNASIYEYDNCFNETEDLCDVYLQTVESKIIKLFQGINTSFFVAGPSRSGKSYTFFGTIKIKGVIAYTVDKILYLIDYMLRGDVMAKIVINNNYTSINWTSKYYID